MQQTQFQCCNYLSSGVDEMLARHIAHLFIRDPISLFSEKINQNDEEDTDHFEVSTVEFLETVSPSVCR